MCNVAYNIIIDRLSECIRARLGVNIQNNQEKKNVHFPFKIRNQEYTNLNYKNKNNYYTVEKLIFK